MAEATYWAKIKPMLAGWDPVRIEGAGAGTPDVNHKYGWLELKWARTWPKGADVPLRVPHYTKEQKAWHMRRCHWGGLCHVLIGVAGESLLFEGDVAAEHLGKSTRAELYALAAAHWNTNETKFMKKELKNAILQGRTNRRG